MAETRTDRRDDGGSCCCGSRCVALAMVKPPIDAERAGQKPDGSSVMLSINKLLTCLALVVTVVFTMSAYADQDIYEGGSRWSELESDGDIYIGGSRVGRIEEDGDVYQGGSRVGKVEADGDIYKGGSRYGKVESDGDIYIGGSRKGRIESDGDIYIGGSRWGTANSCCSSHMEMARIVAVIIFFRSPL